VTADRLRAAIVGAGLMGGYHAQAATRAGGTVVAVVDPDLARARRLADGAVVVPSLDALDPRLAIDVIHVCAPLGEHDRLAEQAIARGTHLLVEKPLTADASTTAAVLTAAKERGVLVVPVHQFLFQPGVQRVLGAPDRYGSLVRCVFEAATAGAEASGLDPEELVAEILPHPLALFSRFTDAPLSQIEWLVVRPAAGELRALAHVATTTFEIVISTHGRPTRATLDLWGTRASAHADLYHGFATIEHGSGSGLRKIARPFSLGSATLRRAGANLTRRAIARETAYPGLRELVRRTYDAIATGSPPPISELETLEIARARDALVASVAAVRDQITE
jgi:predicted dehydrogenase